MTDTEVRTKVQENLVNCIKSQTAYYGPSAVFMSWKYKPGGRNAGRYETRHGVCTGALHMADLDGSMQCLMVWPTINKCLNYISRAPADEKSIEKFLASTDDYAVHCRAFLGWLLNDSHFGAAFLTDDIQDAFRNGIEVNLNARVYVVQPALVMMRRMYEFPEKVSAWFHLVESGVHPRGAAMIVDSVSKSPYTSASGFLFSMEQGGHYAFRSASSTFKSVENVSSDPVVLNYNNIGTVHNREDNTYHREDNTYHRGFFGNPALLYSNRDTNPSTKNREFTKEKLIFEKANPPHSTTLTGWDGGILVQYYSNLDELTKDIMRILEENYDSDSPVFTGVTSDEDGVEITKESAIAA